ncbi:unnamed protein product [Schistocephalus solidus]|uniref:C2H2-type domain-containing protein n=1 Tax=Schistocephalus solidus TaxID=70667 RepID=A0A183TFE0_SCHSO|nr:unnamed protein product [Schistocephalus solidus]
MDTMLTSTEGAPAYLDDIIVTGSSPHELLQCLKTILSQMQEYGFHLRLEKCNIFMPSCEIPMFSSGDSILTYPHGDRTFTSHIGLVSRLRIHCTEADETVRKAPIHHRDRHISCPHTITHRMGLFGYMRIYDSEINHNVNSTDTPCPHSAPAIINAIATLKTAINNLPAPPGFSCPHCVSNFNSRIGLVGHLRIHRTETGEPVPEAPKYSCRDCLRCSHISHRPIRSHAPSRQTTVNHRRLNDISAHYLHQSIHNTLNITMYLRISQNPRNRTLKGCQSGAYPRSRRRLRVLCGRPVNWESGGNGSSISPGLVNPGVCVMGATSCCGARTRVRRPVSQCAHSRIRQLTGLDGG